MNDSQLKARETRLNNHLQNNELLTIYERQTIKEKQLYVDDRKRVNWLGRPKKIRNEEEESLNCPLCDNIGTIVGDHFRMVKTCDNNKCRVLHFNASFPTIKKWK